VHGGAVLARDAEAEVFVLEEVGAARVDDGVYEGELEAVSLNGVSYKWVREA
jgi:hypothetical protein